jgi:hypothetical protein
MTIEKQPPGLWFAFCDSCGEKRELDTDPDDDFTDAVAEIRAAGWAINAPENAKFADGAGFARKVKVTYWTHDCPDCRSHLQPSS